MALIKTIGTGFGDAGYHIVTRIYNSKLPEMSTMIEVQSFRDQAHRETEGARYYRAMTYTLTGDQCLMNATDQQAAAYEWLKTHNDEWADAEDA